MSMTKYAVAPSELTKEAQDSEAQRKSADVKKKPAKQPKKKDG
jgi:hypothetical protein